MPVIFHFFLNLKNNPHLFGSYFLTMNLNLVPPPQEFEPQKLACHMYLNAPIEETYISCSENLAKEQKISWEQLLMCAFSELNLLHQYPLNFFFHEMISSLFKKITHLKQDRPNSSDFPNFYYPIHSSIKEL